MSSSYYDVVFLGQRLSSLAAAGLLAKRGFRVLVLRQSTPPLTFRSGQRLLPVGPFAFLPAQSPVTQRILSELALTPFLRRAAQTSDPLFQIALPGHRLDMWSDADARQSELNREFPEIRRAADDFHARLQSSMARFDELLERDLVWPPTGFFERRKFGRASAATRRELEAGLSLEELSEAHPFRLAVNAVARFNDGMTPDRASPLGLSRPWYQWQQGVVSLVEGKSTLEELLLERVRMYGGVLRDERADRLRLGRGGPDSLRIAGTQEEIGVGHIVVGEPIQQFLRLLRDRRAFGELFERLGEPQPAFYRYCLALTVAPGGIPEGLGRHLFVIANPTKPLHSDNLLWVEKTTQGGRPLLLVQALLHRRIVEESPGALSVVRERIVSSLESAIPFLRENILEQDSPHDGRQPEDADRRPLFELERPWERGDEWMETVQSYPVAGALGVCALPSRSPLPRTLLCNAQVVPGLGLEGELLAAWSCARIISRADRRKEWMRRGLWTKVEL